MFTNLSMKNFKSWKETGDVKLAPLTAFFGTNSSGKSSLLQMLLLLKQTTESSDRNLALKTNEGYVELGTAHEITFNQTNDMHLSVEWKPTGKDASRLVIAKPNGGESITLQDLSFATEIHADPQRYYVKRIKYQSGQFKAELNRGGNNLYTIRVHVDGQEAKRPQGRPRVNMRPQKCYGFSDEALRYYRNVDYLSDVVLSFEQQFQRLYYLGPLREYPKRQYTWSGERPNSVGLRGESAVNAVLAARRGKRTSLEKRVAKWLVDNKLGLAHSFRIHQLVPGGTQYEVRIKRHATSPEVLLPDLGIGVSQILPVLVLCYYAPPGSTIILEQPELHLHPSVQAGLADVLIDVVQNQDVQIILESHSEHLLKRLQRRTAEEKLHPMDVALYFCDIQDGVSSLEELNIDMFGRIRNWPKDFFGDMTGDVVETLKEGLAREIASNA